MRVISILSLVLSIFGIYYTRQQTTVIIEEHTWQKEDRELALAKELPYFEIRRYLEDGTEIGFYTVANSNSFFTITNLGKPVSGLKCSLSEFLLLEIIRYDQITESELKSIPLDSQWVRVRANISDIRNPFLFSEQQIELNYDGIFPLELISSYAAKLLPTSEKGIGKSYVVPLFTLSYTDFRQNIVSSFFIALGNVLYELPVEFVSPKFSIDLLSLLSQPSITIESVEAEVNKVISKALLSDEWKRSSLDESYLLKTARLIFPEVITSQGESEEESLK